ncbi:MAG: cytochrome c oxidase assembly protein [Acidimicrobiales bacterium]
MNDAFGTAPRAGASIKSPSPATSTLIFHWQGQWTSFVALALEVAALAWYLRSVRRLGGRDRSWSPFKTAGFVAGLVVVAYAVEGGIAYYDVSNFTVSVIQHLLLIIVAPPLLAMGAPLTLALQSSSPRTTAVLLRALRGVPARLLTYPLVAFAGLMGTMYVYFLTPLYGFSERHPALQAYLMLHFLMAGCLFWWPMVGKDLLPRRFGFGTRFVLVFLSIPFNAALGLIIASLERPLYPAGNTLADTQSGGNVLWGLLEVVTVAALALLFVQWAREEERKAVRADRQLDAALAAARASVAPPPPTSGTP